MLQVKNVVEGVPNDSQPVSPLPDEARHSRTPVMAAGDKVRMFTYVVIDKTFSFIHTVLRYTYGMGHLHVFSVKQ